MRCMQMNIFNYSENTSIKCELLLILFLHPNLLPLDFDTDYIASYVQNKNFNNFGN